VMYRGSIVETGSAEKITSDPDHPYTQRLLLAAPVSDPVEQERRRAERHRLAENQRQQDEQSGAFVAEAASK
jgi:ABC-type oligopeptide transport system ATPase subunit